MNYELQIEQFQGPLPKLLQLIEDNELEITKISLAKVTDDFLGYIGTLEHVEPVLLADFIVVASRLLLIKSKALMPNLSLTEEEEGEMRELEEKLRLYRDMKGTQVHIRELWSGTRRSLGRPYMFHLGSRPTIFFPATNATKDSLAEAAFALARVIERVVREEEKIEGTLISLEEKMEEIMERMEEMEMIRFSPEFRERTRGEVVALFLAVLHLMREERIVIEQRGIFSDIIVKKRPAGLEPETS